jgi:hypothetical protein
VDEEERSRWGFKLVGAEVDVMGCNGADEDVERTIHPEREDGETLSVGTFPPGGMWGTPLARRSAAAHEWYHGAVHDGADAQAGSARVSIVVRRKQGRAG